MYLVLMYMHFPEKKLSYELREIIKVYGLMHFTLSENVESILENGVHPRLKKPMNYLEQNMVWTYIAYPPMFTDKINEIHSKGEREKYDAVIFIKNLSEEQLNKMRYRRNPEAVVYEGILKTDKMIAKKIHELEL